MWTWEHPIGRAALVVAYLAGLYLLYADLLDVHNEGLLWLIPGYSAAWGFCLGRWWALVLPLTILPGMWLWALVEGDPFTLAEGDLPGYLGVAIVSLIFCVPATLIGVGLRRFVASVEFE